MAPEKPAGKSWDSWTEEQIRDAQDQGDFADLEGKGKPIPGLLEPYDPLWWVKKLMEREKLSVLPAALEIRARVERETAALRDVAREEDVRARVAAINAEIARVNRSTAGGPATSLSPLDPDLIVIEWRRRRQGA
jgi:hypothetical protein